MRLPYDLLLYMMEKEVSSRYDNFIAAFCSTNLGDVSPNIDGAKCHYNGDPMGPGGYEGKPCDYERSTCPVDEESWQMVPGQSNAYCFTLGSGTGPRFVNNENVIEMEHDMKDSTDAISKKQAEKAVEMLNGRRSGLDTTVRSRHKYLHMPSWTGVDENGKTVRLCKAGLGVAMAAGCTDGHGAKLFDQGTNWKFVDEHLGGEQWPWFRIRDILCMAYAKYSVE